MPPPGRRLADLLLNARETLDVEFKEWLDIANDGDHKAVLAKALIGLANHVVMQLYELFDFFRLPASLIAEELTRMRSNRF